jgi:hypothetical protein
VRLAVLRLVTSTLSLGQLPQKHRAGRQTLITAARTTPVLFMIVAYEKNDLRQCISLWLFG